MCCNVAAAAAAVATISLLLPFSPRTSIRYLVRPELGQQERRGREGVTRKNCASAFDSPNLCEKKARAGGWKEMLLHYAAGHFQFFPSRIFRVIAFYRGCNSHKHNCRSHSRKTGKLFAPDEILMAVCGARYRVLYYTYVLDQEGDN